MTEGGVEGRLESNEQRLTDLTRRLERMERRVFPSAAAAPHPQRAPVARPTATPAQPAPPRPASGPPQRGLEEILGGRVLAWVGGVAILLGIVFLLGIAIDRGWIDEPTRTVLGLLGSTSLLLAGVWLYERKGRTEAALAAVASALSGLFTTVLVGTQIYDLIPAEVGLACAGLAGIVGVALAVRWKSMVVAAIGILGALLAPVLVGTGTTGLSLAFMAIALATAVGVLLWQRWNELSLGAFLISAPQLLVWFTDNYDERLLVSLGVLVGFWALYVVAAIGYELRPRTQDEPPVASWLLLLANVVLIAGAGYFGLDEAGHPNAAVAWLLSLAASHILLGAFALRQAINREIGSLLIAVGLGLSAFGFADVLDGPALVFGWAIQAVALAYLATRANREPEPFGSNAERLLIAAGTYLGLAFGHVLVFEAPPTAMLEGVDDLGNALAGLGACAGATLYGRFALRDFDPRVVQVCEAVGAAALVYLASVAIVDTIGVTDSGDSRQSGQVLLSAFWALTGLGAIVYGLLRDVRRFRLGGLALLALAVTKVYTYDLAELEELSRVLSFIALGLLLLVGAFAYQRIQVGVGDDAERAIQ
ncbi:MAG TPA: DUF2339 domain-containing protein [Candidatus Dormibacteraeota bacterium]